MSVFALKPPWSQLVAGPSANVPAGIERLIDRNIKGLTGYRIGPGDASFGALQARPAALGAKVPGSGSARRGKPLRLCIGDTQSACDGNAHANR
jgi:hypothetical protein